MCGASIAPSAMTERTVKARKPHRCCECRCAIVIGEMHEVVSGIWDGEPERFRTCLPCVEWRNAYLRFQHDLGDDYDDMVGAPFGCLAEALREFPSWVGW